MNALIQRLTLCTTMSLLSACMTDGRLLNEPLVVNTADTRTCGQSPYLQRDLSERARYRALDQFYIDREGRPCTY